MKKIIKSLCAMTLVMSICACNNINENNSGNNVTTNEFELGNKSEVVVSNDLVTLIVDETTLTNTNANFTLENNSDGEISYGVGYVLEMKKDGEWHQINVELAFTMQAFGLGASQAEGFNISWENGYGKLASGEYRLLKDVVLENGESITISAEFEIK